MAKEPQAFRDRLLEINIYIYITKTSSLHVCYGWPSSQYLRVHQYTSNLRDEDSFNIIGQIELEKSIPGFTYLSCAQLNKTDGWLQRSLGWQNIHSCCHAKIQTRTRFALGIHRLSWEIVLVFIKVLLDLLEILWAANLKILTLKTSIT